MTQCKTDGLNVEIQQEILKRRLAEQDVVVSFFSVIDSIALSRPNLYFTHHLILTICDHCLVWPNENTSPSPVSPRSIISCLFHVLS